MKKIHISILCVFILLSCDSIRVSSDYNKNINFSNLKTYAFSKQGIDEVKINDIDKNVVEKIDEKVKEWQSNSSYNGNYFDWKKKK